MSDTPETDAIDALPYATYAQRHISKAYRDKARDIERRLKAVEAENAALREALKQAMKAAIDAARKE